MQTLFPAKQMFRPKRSVFFRRAAPLVGKETVEMSKLKKRLLRQYGKVPDPYYFSGDMENIRAYFDFRRDNGLDSFLLDDITWNDLDMDRVYKRINPKRCTSGEQYLYYMLRSPAIDEQSYKSREALIRYAEADADRRLKTELILARLGCTRRADICRAFYPSRHGVGMLFVYLALFLFMIASIVGAILHIYFSFPAVFFSILLNIFVHEFAKRKTQREYDTVNYTVNMIFAMRKLRRLHEPELDRQMTEAYACLDRLQSVIRTGGETQFGHRELQQFVTFIIQSAVCTHHLGTHHGIAMHQPAVFKTLILNGSGF